ncbi:hypothetical protein L6Q79_02085 [bacterium]|nr:hypothetical protein [bacterium]NUN45034.1 hypothetical protein [bacterium]
MKLIAVMTIEQYAQDLRKLFREHHVTIFSESEIRGYRSDATERDPSNWFAHTASPIYSHLVFAFVDESKAAELMQAIRNHGQTMDHDHPMRAFQMHVEQFA